MDTWRPDLEEVLHHYGSRIVMSRGAWRKATCPLNSHDDKSPSASVNLDAGKWNCFSCDERGDAVDIVQHNEALDFKDALSWAKENFRGVANEPQQQFGPKRSKPGYKNWSPPWRGL